MKTWKERSLLAKIKKQLFLTPARRKGRKRLKSFILEDDIVEGPRYKTKQCK
jgi:hypothetical protein